jgi:hypothetical protein
MLSNEVRRIFYKRKRVLKDMKDSLCQRRKAIYSIGTPNTISCILTTVTTIEMKNSLINNNTG